MFKYLKKIIYYKLLLNISLKILVYFYMKT